ncbi:MAG: hypothetical protein ACLUS6_05065 [Dysosmobacter sp.]
MEKADAGAALASTAVDIINAYFDREDTASILPDKSTDSLIRRFSHA